MLPPASSKAMDRLGGEGGMSDSWSADSSAGVAGEWVR